MTTEEAREYLKNLVGAAKLWGPDFAVEAARRQTGGAGDMVAAVKAILDAEEQAGYELQNRSEQ